MAYYQQDQQQTYYQQPQLQSYDPYAAQQQQQYYQQPVGAPPAAYDPYQQQQQQQQVYVPEGHYVQSVQQTQMVYDPVSGQYIQQQQQQEQQSSPEQQQQYQQPQYGSDQSATLNAEDAAAFVQKEKEAEGSHDMQAALDSIASKWNVGKSPTKPKKISLAQDTPTREREAAEEKKQQQQQQQQQQGEAGGDDATGQKKKKDGDSAQKEEAVVEGEEEDDEGKGLVFSGSIEEAPNVRLRYAAHRAENIIAPARGSGFDQIRSHGRPVPPTADSIAASSADFTATVDAFRAEAAALSGGVEVDDIEIAEIGHREKHQDEVARLRDELIKEGQNVLRAHDRLKTESKEAEQATQLVAHRQAPIRNPPPLPKGPEVNTPLLRGNSSTAMRSPSAASGGAGGKAFRRLDSGASTVSRGSAAGRAGGAPSSSRSTTPGGGGRAGGGGAAGQSRTMAGKR